MRKWIATKLFLLAAWLDPKLVFLLIAQVSEHDAYRAMRAKFVIKQGESNGQ